MMRKRLVNVRVVGIFIFIKVIRFVRNKSNSSIYYLRACTGTGYPVGEQPPTHQWLHVHHHPP